MTIVWKWRNTELLVLKLCWRIKPSTFSVVSGTLYQPQRKAYPHPGSDLCYNPEKAGAFSSCSLFVCVCVFEDNPTAAFCFSPSPFLFILLCLFILSHFLGFFVTVLSLFSSPPFFLSIPQHLTFFPSRPSCIKTVETTLELLFWVKIKLWSRKPWMEEVKYLQIKLPCLSLGKSVGDLMEECHNAPADA